MNPVDVLIIYAETLEIEPAVRLLQAHLRDKPADIQHPSMDWWVKKHAREVQAWQAELARSKV